MSETAVLQMNRIVQLVAELSRHGDEDGDGVPIAEVAERLGESPRQIERDLRTLTDASDSPDASWLHSLSIWQEGDRVSASSRGPFRRPLRFTPLELLAIQIGIAWELEGGAAAPSAEAARPEAFPLSTEFAKLLVAVEDGPRRVSLAPASGEGEQEVAELAQRAATERRVLTILYAGEHDLASAARSVEPHQVLNADGCWYVVAWCRRSEGWRHFRADRVIDVALEDETFTLQPDHRDVETPAETLRRDAPPVPVRVRFSPAIARWLAERYPHARRLEGGGLEVEFPVLEPHWLVRHILQYGADAEVIEPPAVRALMRRVLGAG